MNNPLKRISAGRYRIAAALAAAFSFVLLIFRSPAAVSAESGWPQMPDVHSASAIVIEAQTGTILCEKNATDAHYPASITKILTTLLALENASLDETVTFSADAVYKNEGNTSHISRDIGEEMTMEECLFAVMLASANECAYAVAEHVGEKLGGDYQTFIDLMNERAEELGCVNSHFSNANGLPDDTHYTCAYDMALIAQAAYENSTFRTITGTGTYTIPPTNKHDEPTQLINHHNMLYPYTTSEYLYDACVGGKTGYTQDANSTLVTYAQKDGMTLICVVMYADSPDHFEDTVRLMDFCFDSFTLADPSSWEDRSGSLGDDSFDLLSRYEPYAAIDEGSVIVLPQGSSVSDTTVLAGEEEADGSVLLTFYYGNHALGCASLSPTGAEVKNQALFGNDEEAVQIREVVLTPLTAAIVITTIVLLFVLLITLILVLANRPLLSRALLQLRQRRQQQQANRHKGKRVRWFR